MVTRYKVIHAVALKNGTIALAGVLDGEVPDVGSIGVCAGRNIGTKVEVLGVGVVDPNLIAPKRQGLLVKIVRGDEIDLNGSAIEFAPGCRSHKG